MAKPGVMFYFDVRPCIKRLDLNEKGRLFEAILDYAELGVVPELDGALGVAWDFIQPKLDRDAGRYDKQVEQKRYATFARELKKKGLDPIPFDDWKALSDNERNRLVSADTERYPTTTSNPNLQPTTPTTTSTTTGNNRVAGSPSPCLRFIPPTVEEVREFCTRNGYNVDPSRFVNHYQSCGWMIGRTPMADWQAAIRKWAQDEQRNNQPTRRIGSCPPIGTTF